MAARAVDRQRVRAVEYAIEAQVEAEQIDTLLEAMVAQLKTQAATLAVVRHGIHRHRETLRVTAAAAEAA